MTGACAIIAEETLKVRKGQRQEDICAHPCTVSLPALAQEISAKSTVSPHDTIAVLDALMHVLPEHCAHDRVVRLGDIVVSSWRRPGPGRETEERLEWRTFNRPLTEPLWWHWLRQIRES
jgi:hypothetical protein